MASEHPVAPDVIAAAGEAVLAAEEAGHDLMSPVALEAAIRAADKTRGLRVIREGCTTYPDGKFIGRYRLVGDWVNVNE